MTLSISVIEQIIRSEEKESIGFSGEGSQVQQNRKVLLDYYNQKPYGDEIEGMSQIVTSDVADQVNAMQPELIRRFTQAKHIAQFRCRSDEESNQKTEYASWVFNAQNDAVNILGDMFFDANLQYNGVVKVAWDDSKELSEKNWSGLDQLDLIRVQSDSSLEIKKIEQDEETGLFDVSAEQTTSTGRHEITNIPPNELLIARRARDFIDPPFIGQRTPKTRSDLLEMGLPRDKVLRLSKESDDIDDQVKNARNRDLHSPTEENPTSDPSKDIIYLGEYYVKMDVDEDGVSELWQVFFADNMVLEMTRVDDNPYCVHVPIPMPHKAIGTCIAEQVADKQYWKSTLVRQASNNVYATNFNRIAVNERTKLDDLLTPRHGGVVRIKGSDAVQSSIMPMPVVNQVPAVLQMIEYVDSAIEKQTGITGYNQGIDSESLNKTATGFRGIRDMSQMRIELVSRIAASGAVKRIFEKIIALAELHVEDSVEFKNGKKLYQITPSEWQESHECHIDIGLGSGDRQEKIMNLNMLYAEQKELKAVGSPLVDDGKMYTILDKISTEVGLKGADNYFNDPSQPDELLKAENEQLRFVVEELKAQLENPLTEAEQIRADSKIQETFMREQNKAGIERAKLEQQERHHNDEMAVKLTDIETKQKTNVPGSLV